MAIIHIVSALILLGRHVGKRNHLPETGFLFSQKAGKDFVVPSERDAGRAVPDKVDAAAGIGQGDRYLICIGTDDFRLVLFILILEGIFIRSLAHFLRLQVFFQVTGAAENGHMHGLQHGGFPKGLGGRLLSGDGEHNLYPAFRLQRQFLLPLAGTSQGAQGGHKYKHPLSHLCLSPQVKMVGNPSLSNTRSSPQYQLSYTQRSIAVVCCVLVTFWLFRSTFTGPLADQ